MPLTAPAQVLISRRVYKQNGPSYQQIWNYNPADGALQPLTHSAHTHSQPTCSSNGKTILFVSPADGLPGAKRWSFNRATGVERVISNQRVIHPAAEENHGTAECPVSARARDLLACASGREVILFRNQAQITRARVAKQNLRIEKLSWSPSREWLLVGTLGENSNSSSPQSDYYALDVLSRKVLPIGSGNSGLWIPGKTAVLYTTPRELMPLPAPSKHSVWISHVVSFDPTTKKTADITSGLTNDTDLSVCAAR
ncbi:MAG TPA: hypothetical protein VGG97_18695 [Bryobacteraceae bacterium]